MAIVSSKQIKSRIRSMESTRQITKAMEMVASSKLRHAQNQADHAVAYADALRSAMAQILADPQIRSPYLTPREIRRTAYVVIAGDRGFAGGYNSGILKMVRSDMADKRVFLLPIGKKAMDDARNRGMPVFTEDYPEADRVQAGDCAAIAERLCRGYGSGEFDRIVLAYTRFSSALAQEPQLLPLLPLDPGEKRASTRNILFEPDPAAVLDALVPAYLGGVLYGALCESRASEQAARRAAMNAATQNADEMIADLRTRFNQARQAAITREITEIVAGSL